MKTPVSVNQCITDLWLDFIIIADIKCKGKDFISYYCQQRIQINYIKSCGLLYEYSVYSTV